MTISVHGADPLGVLPSALQQCERWIPRLPVFDAPTLDDRLGQSLGAAESPPG